MRGSYPKLQFQRVLPKRWHRTKFCQNGPLCDIELALIDSLGSWSAIEIVEIGFAIVETGGTEFTAEFATAEFVTAELATAEFTVVEFWTAEFAVAEFGSNELADVECVGSSEFVFTKFCCSCFIKTDNFNPWLYSL